MGSRFKICVVDDHPVVRRGVAETFAEEADMDVAGEGETAEDAVRLASELKPDLMVVDVSLPGGGIDAVRRIAASEPAIRLVMLSIHEDAAVVKAALKAGALGYVSKGVSGADLIAIARKVLAGARCVNPELAARLLLGDEAPGSAPDRSGQLGMLTSREQQILSLLADGSSNNEIAKRLELSESTVKHHMTSLMQKLGAKSRTEAALIASRMDISDR
ncbi:MAG: response regulator transcription factor [Hyphomicrobiaceae bacterium]|nr:response regulator transcription factor [Hyphomicrobiaceae bacterium]